jgi:RNA polymerase sigma factor (sigma-70 family)
MRATEDDFGGAATWLHNVQEYWHCRSTLTEADARLVQAFARFCKTCSGLISGLMAHYHLHDEDAADVQQQVWLEVLQSLSSLGRDTTPAGFHVWLGQVVRSRAVDLLRQQGRHPASPIDEVVGTSREPAVGTRASASELETQEQTAVLRSALEGLGQGGKDLNIRLVIMRDREGRTNEEIAKALNMTPKQVRTRLWRGRRRVRAELGIDLE